MKRRRFRVEQIVAVPKPGCGRMTRDRWKAKNRGNLKASGPLRYAIGTCRR